MSKISIIIVNWNAGNHLQACLHSIKHANITGIVGEVIIVDNASTDHSVTDLDILDLHLKIIHNSTNKGFAYACNQGAKEISSDYILFLNPDTILNRDTLIQTLNFAEKDENIGVIGIKLLNEKNGVAKTCARLPKPRDFFYLLTGLNKIFPKVFPSFVMREWNHETTRRVDHVIGAFYFIKRQIFNDLKGFDERFFVYLEDLDLSLRVLKAGWEIKYLAEASAFHKGGGTSEQVKAKRLFYSLRSRIQYGYKHFSFTQATLLAIGTLFLEPFSRIIFTFIQFSPNTTLETIQGYLYLWQDVFLSLFCKGKKE